MNAAILLAAGESSRMGQNKLLVDIGGATALERVFSTLRSVEGISRIVIVVSEQTQPLAERLCKGRNDCTVIFGGKTRAESVYAGLLSLENEAVEIVAIHDAARCMATKGDFESTIASARRLGSGVAGTRAVDTIKLETPSGLDTPDRSKVWIVQTPQTFLYANVKKAYDAAFENGWTATDDAEFVERVTGGVHMVECGPHNLKLTVPDDLTRARAMLSGSAQKLPRTGIGEDFHRLVTGRRLVLGGVDIPFEKGLLGHSDADALVHAICDALLGAAALGDIGVHFPDTAPEYKDISSLILLGRTGDMVKKQGFGIANIDSVIIAQAPKLAPHMNAMRANIALTLGIPVNAVGVKATTTEGMGVEGRGEGISAKAVALLYRV